MKFYPNDGRPGIEINTIEDIRNYMGNVVDSFDTIEIDQGLVIAYIGGQPVIIGNIRMV